MKYSTYIKPKNKIPRRVHLPRSLYLKTLFRKLRKLLIATIPVVLIVLVGYFLYLVMFNSDIFSLSENNIEIQGVGSFIDLSAFEDSVYSHVIDSNVVKLDATELSNKLLSEFPSIKSIDIKKNVPPHLTINVEERVPLFFLYKDKEDDGYMIDEGGFILGKIQDRYKDLFKAKYLGDLPESGFLNPGIVSMYKNILEGVDSEGLRLEGIVFDKSITTIYLSNNPMVIFSNDKGVQDAFKIVSSILSKFGDEDKKVSKIDLRYDKVIVSYD